MFRVFGVRYLYSYATKLTRRAKSEQVRRAWATRIACWLVGCCAFVSLAGCNAKLPALLRVESLTPKAAEPGDSLTLFGGGFLANAPARVELRGTAFRNATAEEGVRVVLTGRARSAEVIELTVTPELSRALLQQALHATFRGVVEVSFKPTRPGAAPLVGRMDAAVFDLFARRDPESPRLDSPSGVKFADHLALEVERSGAGKGLLVQTLQAGGAGARAGLQALDRIVVNGGLNVFEESDLEPYAGQRVVSLGVRRAGQLAPLPINIPTEGFSPPKVELWGWGLALAGASAALLLLLRGPGGLLFSLLTAPVVPESGVAPRRSGVLAQPRVTLPRGLSAFMAVSAVFAVLQLGLKLPLAELSLVWWFAGVLGLRMLAALCLGGFNGKRWALSRGLWRVVHVGPTVATLGLVVAAVATDHGSLSIAEIGGRQLVLPAGHYAFTSPVGFLGALCTCLVAYSEPALSVQRGSQFLLLRRVGQAASDAQGLLAAAGLIALFLGFGSAPSGLPWFSVSVWATICFELKLCLAFVFLIYTRRIYAGNFSAAASKALLWLGLPAALLELAVVPVWSAPVWPAWLKGSFSGLVLVLIATLVVTWVAQGFGQLRLTARLRGLNPWL